MFTDMVGYTTLGQQDESLSLALLEEQSKVIRRVLGRHNGRESTSRYTYMAQIVYHD
jgi:hypothetical protein